MATTLCAMFGNSGEPLESIGFLNIPDGSWKMKSTATGSSFPGFGSNVIPIAMNVSTSGDDHDQTNGGSLGCSGTANINGKEACYASGGYRGTQFTGHTHPIWVNCSGRANSVFLPFFYNMDLTAVQNGIKSGTITVWLEKAG